VPTESAAVPGRIKPAELRAMDRQTFVATFGEVFEHSPWVAEEAWRAGPFDDAGGVREAMVTAVDRAGRERQLALVHAHPDLAGKAAVRGELTDASRREQAGSGLDQLSPEEFARFQELNGAYCQKFGFPFVMAVKRSGKDEILRAFAERLGNTPEQELDRALEEIGKIAGYRLADLVEGEP
jgi:2-oxo-4-hydroxy-4-carboxy-5-ureidoimidazoline decarboxylase